jgi:hypothetical protein
MNNIPGFGAESSLHRRKVGGGDMESGSALEQNHRSTDVKSAGAWMNNTPDSGAKSSLHRRKVGGGVDE